MRGRAGIIICDKSRLFREGLVSLLKESQFKIQSVCTDLEEVQQLQTRSTKGMTFLLGANSAAEFDLLEVANLKQTYPGSHVVLLINSCSEEQRWQAAHYGIDGVLLKSISTEVLCLSLELVLKSQSVFIVNADSGAEESPRRVEIEAAIPVAPGEGDGTPADKNADRWTLAPASPVPAPVHAAPTMISSRREGLSDRELEILDCLVNGHSNKLIARRCNITEATVKVHLKAILRKISVANRTQAAVWAINKMHRSSAQIDAPVALNIDRGHLAAVPPSTTTVEADDGDSGAEEAVDPPVALALVHSRGGDVRLGTV